MKTFIFSITAIAIIIISATAFSLYVCHTIEDITSKCDKISSENSISDNYEIISNVKTEWKKQRKFIGLFISKSYQQNAELSLLLLEDFIIKNDAQGIEYARRCLIAALDDIIYIEGRNFFSIF